MNRGTPPLFFENENTKHENAQKNTYYKIPQEGWDGKCPYCHNYPITKLCKSNAKGNQGKPYATCIQCDKFLGFIPLTYIVKNADKERERETEREREKEKNREREKERAR